MPGNNRAAKRESLKRHGTLNPHPDRVTDPLFQQSDFFDPEDLVQVKYEMLRRVTIDQQSVSRSAEAFGFSRPTYYQTVASFERDGLRGLVPQKRGPRHAHKLTAQVLDFVRELQATDPAMPSTQLAAAIQTRFGVKVHPRTIERAVAGQKKKRR